MLEVVALLIVGLSRLPEEDEQWICRVCFPPSGTGIHKAS